MSTLITINTLILFLLLLLSTYQQSIISPKNDKNDDPFTEETLSEYINQNIKNQTNAIFDPDLKLTTDTKTRLLWISDDLAKYYDVHLYLIIVQNTTKTIDLNVARAMIKYPSNITYEFVILVLFNHCQNNTKNYLYSIGENLLYDSNFTQKIQDKLTIGLTYSNLKYIYTSFRNKYVKPDQGWTPQNLVSLMYEKFANETEIPYLYYDPLCIAEYDSFKASKKYFDDLSTKGVRALLISIDNVPKGDTDYFITNFAVEIHRKFNISLARAVYSIYFYENKLFEYRIGLELGKLNEVQQEKIIDDGTYFGNLTLAFSLVMQDFRNFIGGEYLGWRAVMFYDHLYNSTSIYRDINFIYCNDLNVDLQRNFTKNPIISGTLENLNNYNSNIFIFVFNKMDPDLYGGSLKVFHEDLMKYFKYPRKVSPENAIFFYGSISDNVTHINVGTSFSQLIKDNIIGEITDKSREVLAQKFSQYSIIMYVLRAIRYHLVIKNYDFTPEIFSSYFNDIYDYSKYKLHDPNNTLDSSYMKDNKFDEYFSDIFTGKTSMYLIVLNKIDTQFTNTTQFTEQMGSYFSSSSNPTSTNLNMFIAVYFAEYGKFEYYKGRDNYRITSERIEKIKSEIAAMKEFEPTKAAHLILKYTRYYCYIMNSAWTGKIYANTINDFIGKPYYILFDPDDVLVNKSVNYLNIQAYIRELADDEAINMNTFFLINKNSTSSNGIMAEEFKNNYILPDGTDKNNCFYIILNSNLKQYDYSIGKNLEKFFTKEMLDEIINEECSNNLHDNIYYGVKCLTSTLRLFILAMAEINDVWSYKKLESFLTNYYFKENPESTENYLFFDYDFEFTLSSENNVRKKLGDFALKQNANFFFFIVEEVDEDEEIFLQKLFDSTSFTTAKKENSVYLLYCTENDTLTSVVGSEISNLLSPNNYNNILKMREVNMKIDLQDGVNFFLEDIDQIFKHPKVWNGAYLKEYINNLKEEIYMGVIDPYLNLNNQDNDEVTKLMKKSYINQVSTYAIVLPYLKDGATINELLEDIKVTFPLPSEITSDVIVYICFITSKNQFGIITAEDYYDKFNKEFINKALKEVQNKNLYDGLMILCKKIFEKSDEDNHSGGDSDKKIKILKIVAGVLTGVVIIFIALAIACRKIRKGREQNKPINYDLNESSNKILCLNANDNSKNRSLLDNIAGLEEMNNLK